MKRLISLMTTVVVATIVNLAMGEIITKEVAKMTADNLLSLDSEWQGMGDADIRLVEKDGTPAYYVIEYNRGGWAIVSAQSAAKPLIAYNPTGEYEAPEPMQQVLDYNARYIVDLSKKVTDVKHEGWRRAMQRKPAAEPASTPDVAPLITFDLNQGDPFNAMCPTIGGEKCLVGCVAVGMAQAMMVQRYPESPTGRHAYQSEGIGTLSIDYDAEKEYDWDAMYRSHETGNFSEIARLVYHCGVSVNMQYGIEGSGTQTTRVADALPRNFRYNESLIRWVDKPATDEEWLTILLDELLLGRVIVYRGQSEESGHCWNIDGWKQSTQMVHVNWGWGGYGNSYFDIGAMQDKYQGMSFPYMNGAVIGVGTPTTAPYGIKLSKTKFAEGTAAGVVLADVTVSCEDETAEIGFETFGPKNVRGQHTTSPYQVQDGKLVATKAVANTNAFKYLKMKVTNLSTGETFEKEFSLSITDAGAVDAALSDAMRVYPSVTTDVLTVETPTAGGEYAVYNMTGAQVAAGEIDGYKTDINVSSLVPGTYILRYMHSDGVGVKTFIKK